MLPMPLRISFSYDHRQESFLLQRHHIQCREAPAAQGWTPLHRRLCQSLGRQRRVPRPVGARGYLVHFRNIGTIVATARPSTSRLYDYGAGPVVNVRCRYPSQRARHPPGWTWCLAFHKSENGSGVGCICLGFGSNTRPANRLWVVEASAVVLHGKLGWGSHG